MSMPPYDPSRPVYCPHCGAPIRPHDKFCLHCGKQLPMASRQQAADTVRQTAMRASNACESERATAAPPARRSVRRLPLLLIALLLGIGVGYFLVRAPSSGATRAAAHSCFIRRQMAYRLTGCPCLPTKTGPEVILLALQ